MKRLFPLLLCCLCGTGVFAQSDSNTRVIELTVTLDPTKIEYYYDEETGGYAVDYHGSADETLEGAYESGEPDIPFMEKVIPIKESEIFICMTYSFT